MNFEAVDWHTEVYLGGRHIGNHSGGYDGFSFDITDHAPAGEEVELLVGVWDPTEGVSYPLKIVTCQRKWLACYNLQRGKCATQLYFIIICIL